VFYANNTYQGSTTVEAGELRLNSAGKIENSSEVKLISNTAKLGLNGANKTIKNLNSTFSGAIVSLGGNTLTIGTSTISADGGGSFAGVFEGTGGNVTKQGTQTFTMSGANTATGSFTTTYGTVVFSNTWAGDFIKYANSTLTVSGNTTVGKTLTLFSNSGTNAINMNLSGATPSKLTATGGLFPLGTGTTPIVISPAAAPTNQVLIQAASGVDATKFTLTNTGQASQLTHSADGKQLLLSPTATPVSWQSLVANGSSGTETTTALSLNFDAVPTGLTIGHIKVTGATKGTLTGSTRSRLLTLSNITVANGENVTVELEDPAGLNITPKIRTVAVYVAAPVLSGTVTISGNAVFGQTLTANTSALTSTPSGTLGTLGYQWKRGATNIGTGATYTLVQADIGSTITVTVTAANCTGSVTSGATPTVTKATQTATDAPTLAGSTQTSITLNTVAGCEYSRNGGAWQTSAAFTGLTQNTSYSFTQRLAETATHSASPASTAVSFTTPGPTFVAVTGISNVPDTARVGIPLTLTGTVMPANATNQAMTWTVVSDGGTGATIKDLNVLTALNTGTVKVRATIVNGRTASTDYTQDFDIKVIASTGIAEIAFPDLKIFPNPFAEEVHVTAAEGGTLRVMNITGVLVHTQPLSSYDETLRLAFLPKGVYFFLLEKDGKMRTEKVMKGR